jgi:hypothetical protein
MNTVTRQLKALAITLLICSFAQAQLDVTNLRKVQFGVMHDKTNLTGLYALQDRNTGAVEVDLKEERTTINAEIKVTVSQKDYITTANLEGFAYMLGRLVSLANKKELFNDFDTPLDPLSAGNCKNITFPSGPQYKDVARFSNNHIFDVTTSSVIKESPFFWGINASLRTLGFPPRYTSYRTEFPQDKVAITTMSATWKILYGFNVGFRKNLGSKAALLFFAGVNRGINQTKNSTVGLPVIQVRYNPFINPTLFFGKKMGGYIGLYYEMMNCKDAIAFASPTNLATGVASPQQDIYKTKVSESQLLLKVGFYFTSKKENR